ncbi:MAG: hypothetical protein VB957_17735 [Pseudomonadales bacterium]
MNLQQTETAQADRQKMLSQVIGLNHSAMAMKAAKQMRRSKQKQRTGRVVCHHLRMMLAANASAPARENGRVSDSNSGARQRNSFNAIPFYSIPFDSNTFNSGNGTAENLAQKQYSLSLS